MQASNKILEKYFKCLRKTQHGFVVDAERGNFLSVKVNNFAGICRGIIGTDHLQGLVSVVVQVSERGGAKEEV